jgi:hypothetical protein
MDFDSGAEGSGAEMETAAAEACAASLLEMKVAIADWLG